MNAISFTPPAPVEHVARRLAELGGMPHYVGGAVRDSFIGRAPHDYDLASAMTPDAVQLAFDNVIMTGARHGTVTVVAGGMNVEVTTFRSDGAYADGRHPDAVTFVGSIEHDLARRDFTMNAIAIDAVVRTVVDPHGGVSDALAGKIRTVGDARLRFAEDGLRAMRAVRFASQLGFRIDDATLLAIEPDLLSGVSRERIRDELVKTLNGIQPGEAIGVLHSTGLLQRAIGMPMADAAQCVAPVLGTVPTNLRLAVALCTAGIAPVNVKTLTQVLKFDSHEARTCSFAASAFSVLNADRSAYAVRRTLSLFGRDATMAAARALDDLAVATAVQHEPLITVRSLPFNGDDIMRELGLSGAAVGTAMRAGLAAAIVDPGLLEDRHGLLELVSKHSAA